MVAAAMEGVDLEPAEQEADLEPCQVMDLLELNHELGAQVQQLEAAVRSHRRIGIATGLVMAQHHVEVDDAFGVLRRASQDSNRRLRDIAEDVISAGRLPPVLVRRQRGT
jgi:AmiR/NasT family two-component response regulator